MFTGAMMHNKLPSLIAALVLLSIVGCAAPVSTSAPTGQAVAPATSVPTVRPVQPGGQLVVSDKQRVTSPATSPADAVELGAGNRAFAFDLYQSLRKQGGNLFYSPYSISLALAMTFAGAKGQTAQQMASALHFTLSPERLHPAFDSLDLALASRAQGTAGQGGKGFKLSIANAIWGQDGFQFLPDFLSTLSQNYGAGLRLMDFKQAPEASRIAINNWVSDQTAGKIKDLIPPGAIDPLTRLVLTNAIYFNAAWAQQFNPKVTADGPFTLPDGNKINAPMMSQTAYFAYTEGKNYQAVELPYEGQKLSMVILLPAAGQLDAFEGTLGGPQVDAILGALTSKRIALKMPRFKTEYSISLKQTLQELGMRDAFTNADFSGMTGNRDLSIGAVIHKAYVAVDENGTEAAAATAVTMPTSVLPGQPIEVSVDRPFIFLIRDIETGALLFVGRIVTPAG